MKNINEQFEEFDCEEFEFDGIDNKIALRATIIAGVFMIIVLLACYGFIQLIF